MSDETRFQLDAFWELLDEILNAVLFVILGLEVLILSYTWESLLISLAVIPIVLVSRFISIGFPISFLSQFRKYTPGAIRILTWGGLRGGISVALALSIPPTPERNIILAITYTVVLFSILIQGSTIKSVVNHFVDSPENTG